MTEIEIKRVRAEPEEQDGTRILVDRMWPRGVSKEDAQLDDHVKDVAPTTQLRKWFGHDPEKWDEFRKKYRAELDDNPAAQDFLQRVRQSKRVTLLFGAKDTEHNQAVVLRDWLQKHL